MVFIGHAHSSLFPSTTSAQKPPPIAGSIAPMAALSHFSPVSRLSPNPVSRNPGEMLKTAIPSLCSSLPHSTASIFKAVLLTRYGIHSVFDLGHSPAGAGAYLELLPVECSSTDASPLVMKRSRGDFCVERSSSGAKVVVNRCVPVTLTS